MDHRFKTILYGLFGMLAVLAVFQVGVLVGYRKASYSYRWTDNYHKMFAGPARGFAFEKRLRPPPPMRRERGFMDAHGMFGVVLKADPDALIIEDKDGMEKTVILTPRTVVRDRDLDIRHDQIPTDAQVVIIGRPTGRGEVEAKLIRVIPQE
jgi:hypothetical protein